MEASRFFAEEAFPAFGIFGLLASGSLGCGHVGGHFGALRVFGYAGGHLSAQTHVLGICSGIR